MTLPAPQALARKINSGSYPHAGQWPPNMILLVLLKGRWRRRLLVSPAGRRRRRSDTAGRGKLLLHFTKQSFSFLDQSIYFNKLVPRVHVPTISPLVHFPPGRKCGRNHTSLLCWLCAKTGCSLRSRLIILRVLQKGWKYLNTMDHCQWWTNR